MPIADHQAFAYTDTKVEIWTVPATTPKHSLVKQEESGRYGVTIPNATGVAGTTIEIGPFTIAEAGLVGVGTEETEAIAADAVGVALDGTWVFLEIDGADLDTVQGTPVFIDGDGDLTVTEADGEDRVGVVNYPASYVKTSGALPVKIGE